MFTNIRNTSGLKWLVGAVLAAIVIGGLLLNPFQGAAQEPKLLQLSDLPDGFVVFSETQLFAMSAEDKVEDVGHFIDAANLELRGYSPEQQRLLSSYHSRQSFGAAGDTFGEVVIVMNYVYEYASQEEAAAAVKILHEDFGNMTAPQPEITAEASTNGLRGARFEILDGPEGDSCYWFIGQRDNTLVVLFANGFNVDVVSSAYQLVLEKIQ